MDPEDAERSVVFCITDTETQPLPERQITHKLARLGCCLPLYDTVKRRPISFVCVIGKPRDPYRARKLIGQVTLKYESRLEGVDFTPALDPSSPKGLKTHGNL